MISRRTRLQLLVFVIIAGLGITYVGGKYAGLGRLFGATTYTVTIELPDSGGIFTNAEVTHEGVTVGRVGEIRPTEEGVDVELLIEKDSDEIPETGVQATVKNMSIIGEPYVDLTTDQGVAEPYLEDGSTIPVAQTSTPVPPSVLLATLNDLLDSVPKESVTVVLRELDLAFAGTGPDLARLLDNTSDLVASAQESLPETLRLIRESVTVLRTQNDEAGSIRSFSSDLRSLAAQLEDSDADIQRLLQTGPAFASETIALLEQSGPGLSQLIADLLTGGRLAEPRNQAIRQLLITYPALARAAYSAVPGDGTVHFGLVLNAFDPPPCTRGYESTKRRSGTETKDIPANADATCKEPRGSPIAVRGSQNAPRQGVPGAVSAPTSQNPSASTRSQPGKAVGPRGRNAAAATPELLARLAELVHAPRPGLVGDPTEILLLSLGSGQ